MKFTKTLTAAAIIAAGFALNAQAADKMTREESDEFAEILNSVL